MMKVRGKQISLLIVCLVAINLIACNGFVETAYKTLFTAGQAYDSTMKSVAQLQKDGKITLEQRATINKAADVYYVSFQGAATALSVYNRTKSAEDKSKLSILISEMIKNYSTFLEVVNKFSPGTGKIMEVK